MKRNILKVNVTWTEDNYACAWEDGMEGTVLVTAKSITQLKEDFEESLRLHIEGCVADGDSVPSYLVENDYEIEYNLDAAALIRNAEAYTTLLALSKASGINQRQLSHYANGVKHPRPMQLQRIKDGLHSLGRQLLALGL